MAEAREEAELTLLKLHQVQEELESLFLADQSKQKQVDDLKNQVTAKAAELEKERGEGCREERVKALEGELAGVKGDRDVRAKEVAEAREEAELTLLKLHQVQEKFESVFLADQSKQEQLDDVQNQVTAKAAELERERNERAAGAECVKALEVELAAGAERVKALEGELAGVKEECDRYIKLNQNQSELIASSDRLSKRMVELIASINL